MLLQKLNGHKVKKITVLNIANCIILIHSSTENILKNAATYLWEDDVCKNIGAINVFFPVIYKYVFISQVL